MAHATATETVTCFWNCGDNAPEHTHYSVLIRDANTNKLLGRLGANGYTVNRKIRALIFSKARAEEIAAEINQENGDFGEFTAKVIKF